jgi:hypothetical protein
MSSLVVIPARSVALTMEELLMDSPLAGNRASAAFTVAGVEDFTVAAEVTRAEVTGNSVSFIESKLTIWRTKSCTRRI